MSFDVLAFLALIAARHQRDAFGFAIVAVACFITMLAIFFVVTFPVNRNTRNWTTAPEDWASLRKRWEYSHAASALLSLAAFAATALAVIRFAPG